MKTIQIKDEALPLVAQALREEVARRREASRHFVHDSGVAAQARRRETALLEDAAAAMETA